MSFSWKTLLGAGSSGSQNAASASTVTGGERYGGAEDGGVGVEEEHQPLWGLENFGNTCYANSILQALYFCQPFREVVLNFAELPGEKTSSIRTISQLAETDSTTGASTSLSSSVPLEKSISSSEASTDLASTAGTSLSKSPWQHPSSPKAPAAEPDTLLINLYRLFRSISAASAEYKQNEAAALAAATAGGSKGAGGLPIKAGKNAKGKAMLPGRQTTTMSKNGGSSSGVNGSIAPSAPGAARKRDLGISAGLVDESAVKGFLAALRRENVLFDSTAHQDAHEFLNFMLNQIGEHMGKIDEQKRQREAAERGQVEEQQVAVRHRYPGEPQDTQVHRLFEGTLTNETRCLTCEAVTSRDECFLDLSIDIEHNTSVTACLRQFSASETLRSRNKFFCDGCSGLQEAEKRMKIRKLPAVLALHLKRFKYEEETQRYVKLAYRVVFPLQLRLFNTADDAEDPDRLYELFGIVVHIGVGPHHGHYVSIVKVGTKWAIFDDDAVHYIDQLDISKYFGDAPGTGSAYVLFYQAMDLDRQALGLPPESAAEVRAKMTPWLEANPPPGVESHAPAQKQISNQMGLPTTVMSASGTASPASMASPSMHTVNLDRQSSASSAQGTAGGPLSGGLFRRRERNSSVTQTLAGDAHEQREREPSNSGGTVGNATSGGWRSFGRKAKSRSISMSESASNQSQSRSATGPAQLQAQASFQGITQAPRGYISSTASPERPPKAPGVEESDAESESTHASSSMGSRGGSSRTSKTSALGNSKLGNSQPIISMPSSSSTFKANPFEQQSVTGGSVVMTPQALPSPIAEVPDRTSPLAQQAFPALHVSEASPTGGEEPSGGLPLRRSPDQAATPTEQSRPSQSSSATDRRSSIASSIYPPLGATFAPVDHPLSKKDQTKLAKEARRRSSTTMAAAAAAAVANHQAQVQAQAQAQGGGQGLEQQQQQQQTQTASRQHPTTGPSSSSNGPAPVSGIGDGNGNGQGAAPAAAAAPGTTTSSQKPAHPTIGKGLPSSLQSQSATQSTASPASPSSAAVKRRSTLSRFGFGLGKDKDKDKDKEKR
ncbi:cysteine proteinase [Microstroma glucosiphilum]|uniref:ubiquitinyl hydrolase 1 n=1 Tax=Pseudomicrostroma glucosiphilum TaxID=1684307 RepID=A0A316UEP0_9BASI|nr:cysteine proteinase [Pseudomicrostroma glucosiphilum]PWN22861.1 cysteine proteinase [Pseudomicrostroma glucosiphilum]